MGRVNSRSRLKIAEWFGCDSADGTYLAYGPDKNLPKLLKWLDELDGTPSLLGGTPRFGAPDAGPRTSPPREAPRRRTPPRQASAASAQMSPPAGTPAAAIPRAGHPGTRTR